LTDPDHAPPRPERKPLVGGRGILAGMGVALAFMGAAWLLLAADWGADWTWSVLFVGFLAVIVWCALKHRNAIALGMALGLVLMPVLAVLVLLSICAAGGFRS
jgi:hypothetical protein